MWVTIECIFSYRDSIQFLFSKQRVRRAEQQVLLPGGRGGAGRPARPVRPEHRQELPGAGGRGPHRRLRQAARSRCQPVLSR